MIQYLSGMATGLVIGFCLGIITPYAYKIYKKYNKTKNITRATLEEAFTICSTHIFSTILDTAYDPNANIDLQQMPNMMELVDVSTNILKMSNEFNKSFKIVYKQNNIVIKIIDKKIMRNQAFLEILCFFKKNNMDLIISDLDSEHITNTLQE